MAPITPAVVAILGVELNIIENPKTPQKLAGNRNNNNTNGGKLSGIKSAGRK